MLQRILTNLFGRKVLRQVLESVATRILAVVITLLGAYEIDPQVLEQFKLSTEALIAAASGVLASVLLSWFRKANDAGKEDDA